MKKTIAILLLSLTLAANVEAANVLNRITKEFRASVNTPDFPTASWIINPDMSAVAGFASKYWVISGDLVLLMSQAERDAVDAKEAADAAAAAIVARDAARDAAAEQLNQVEDIMRAFALVLLDELNSHKDKINAILTAIDAATSLAEVKTNIGAIADYPTRTVDQLRAALRAKLGS